MKGGKRPLGYTIIEVMIVLAVSGVMFLIASTFIAGRQARTAFTGGVNEMASRLQATIEQVTDGQYSDILLNCRAAGGVVSFPPAAPNQQGSNSPCVFLGKVIHLSENSDPTKYETFSVAGSRLDNLGNPAVSLVSADAQYIPNLTSEQTVSQQLRINQVTIDDGTLHHFFGFGFFQGQGVFDVASGELQTGAQTVSMYYVNGLTNTASQGTAQGLITGANLKPAQTVNICLTDGNRYANLILGSNNNQLGVDVEMDGTTKPATCI